MERRLTAILAADVVGYSRLMTIDEAGTLAALKSLRNNLVNPKISEHNGRIFKLTGDGILIEFPSVVSAVACAVDIPISHAHTQCHRVGCAHRISHRRQPRRYHR